MALLGAAGACGRTAVDPPRAPVTATQRLLAQARAEERARRYDSARALYERAAREAPDRASAAPAWRALARALLFWGEIGDAEAALERAVDSAPGEASAWHDLGIVRARRGHPAGAERALRRAIALAPREPRPRVALAALLVNQRRWPDALDQYRALQRLPLPGRTRDAVARAIELIETESRRRPRPGR
ncbi:MAG TPA: tetratricopeptide repeat protein [Kofleriaceae bacterium]|nr:tetratricopeptide repeat protein [Kofleriaceae bacterium]